MPAFALWLRLALTVAFVVSGGYCLRRCGSRQSRPIHRLNDVTHVLMSVEMIAMAWAVAVPDPLGIQLVVFGVAAVWFALQATGVPLRRAALIPLDGRAAITPNRADASGHGIPSRTQCVHHAVLLAAMIWMVVAIRRDATEMSRPSTVVAGLLGAYCLLAALAWIIAVWWPGAGTARGRGRIAMSHVGMTTAMGVMLIAMR
jgi:uncharacterized protein DUF5134